MTIPTVYLRCPNKKRANTILHEGGKLHVTEYILSRTNHYELPTDSLPDGTVIKLYDKWVDGNPYAKAYGNWDAKKQRIK